MFNKLQFDYADWLMLILFSVFVIPAAQLTGAGIVATIGFLVGS
jgi:hypothetical protein